MCTKCPPIVLIYCMTSFCASGRLNNHLFGGRIKAVLYSLCGISIALKFKAVPSRYHCKSLYGDRAVELEPSGAGALVSACCDLRTRPVETVSTPASPRLLADIDSCPFRPLPSKFSIKNDDALDEVGIWLSVSFSCMFSRFDGAFYAKTELIQVVILSIDGFAL